MLLKICSYSLLVGHFMISQWSWAVDSSVLWLPKKYSDVKPKLLNAAREAEGMERCAVVIAGEMIVSKNTEEHYYLVITCRDIGLRSYNLSYQYSKKADDFDLLAEQRSSLSNENRSSLPNEKRESLPIKDGMTKERAVQMCRDALAEESALSNWIKVLDDAVEEMDHDDEWIFHLKFPFQGKNRFDEIVEFSSECFINEEDGAQIHLGKLHKERAVQMCRDALAEESVLSNWTKVLDDAIEEIDHDDEWIFHLKFPFQGKNRFDEIVEFSSECFINEKEGAQIHLGKLHKEQALENCYEGLEDESILIGKIKILFDEVSEVKHESHWAYRYNLPFTTNNRKSELVRYNADCLVNSDGESEVETRIDVASIESMCLQALTKEAKMMIGVEILKDKIQPVEEQEYNFYVQIPFDATDPIGRKLHYVGECNVNDTGRSRIDIKPFLK
jgi:hypothetical protein